MGGAWLRPRLPLLSAAWSHSAVLAGGHGAAMPACAVTWISKRTEKCSQRSPEGAAVGARRFCADTRTETSRNTAKNGYEREPLPAPDGAVQPQGQKHVKNVTRGSLCQRQKVVCRHKDETRQKSAWKTSKHV